MDPIDQNNQNNQTNPVPTVPADNNGQVSDAPVSQPQSPAQGTPVVPVAPVGETQIPVENSTNEIPVAPVTGDVGEAVPGAVSGGEENQGEEQGGVTA